MSELLCWLALSQLPGIGPVTGRYLLEHFAGKPESIFLAAAASLREVGLNEMQIAAIHQPDWMTAKQHLEWAEKNACRILTAADADWPALLREIHGAPLLLYVKGDPKILSLPQLAIVGSRHPTQEGLDHAGSFAREIARAGFVITSGLAAGIDAAAHAGALLAGRSIGVLGTGLAQIYPAAHRGLAEKMIASGGALVSEFAPLMKPLARNFPLRNRIISGLACGVLIVEAARQSGSLITARYALEQNREVFALPGSIHNPLVRGCHQLIRAGAKLVETASDILEEVGILSRTMADCRHQNEANKKEIEMAKVKITEVNINPGEQKLQQVLEYVNHAVTAQDVIIARTALTAAEVSSILLTLELRGYVESVPGGYRRTNIRSEGEKLCLKF